jgi:hypothetical protein
VLSRFSLHPAREAQSLHGMNDASIDKRHAIEHAQSESRGETP